MRPSLPVVHQLFLTLSRFDLSEEDLFACIRRVNQQAETIDINAVCELALKNGTAGLLYKNIEGQGIFPKAAEEFLRSRYLECRKHNEQMLEETLHLLAVLSARGIPAIPLKGAIAAEILFRDLGVYPSGDMDLLVHPSDLSMVKDILRKECGYTQPPEVQEEDLLAGHYHLLFQKNGLLCEVHWNCVKRYFVVPPAFWWEDMGEIALSDGSVVPQLSTEKYLLYLIFRLFDHGFQPLRFLVLIDGLIKKYSGTISWDRLMCYADRLRMKRLTFFVFGLLHEMLGSDTPRLATNNKILGHGLLQQLVSSGIFMNNDRPHLRMAAYSLLLDSPWGILKILLGRFAPTPSELRLRYRIPGTSSKVYWYYLINPLRMFMRKRR